MSTIGAIALAPGRDPTTPAAATGGVMVPIRLDAIPEGVSARRLRGVPVFLVRDGRDVTVFPSDPQHLTGETQDVVVRARVA